MDIAINIICGLITAILIFSVQIIRKKIKDRLLKRLFGNDLGKDFQIIFPAYHSPQGAKFAKPQSRVHRRTFSTVNLTTVNSTASSRSVSHLAYLLGRYSKTTPSINSDVELDEKMDISFISVGGLNNYKSVDTLDCPINSLITFDNNVNIVAVRSRNPIIQTQQGFDYGIILKIIPPNNINRTWLCCSGMGEWGASGAAWWLSKHWKRISKQTGRQPFAVITKTRIGSDDSTQMIYLFLSDDDVENATQP